MASANKSLEDENRKLQEENRKLREAINWWNNGEASKTLYGLCNAARKFYRSEEVSLKSAEELDKALKKYEEWCKKYHPEQLED